MALPGSEMLPTLEAWVKGLRGSAPSSWQVTWWKQYQDSGFPERWVPSEPWSESEMCELLVLWLAREVARGGRRQLVWATGRRGGERPFYLAAREISRKLACAEGGAVGEVSRLLRRAASAAGGRDPLAVVAVDGHVTGGQRWLPPGCPGILTMDIYDLVSGLLFRCSGVMDGQAELVAAGLASAAAWVLVDTILPRAAWQTLDQLREIIAAEPGVTDRIHLGIIGRCVGAMDGSASLPALDGVVLQPVSVARGRFASELAKLALAGIPPVAPQPDRPHTLVVVNRAATAMAVGAALEQSRVGQVRVITGQEVRRVADARWQELAVSPESAAIWVLSEVADVTGLPPASRMITEVAAWDVLAQRVGQWTGSGPVMVLGGHMAEGPAAMVWETLTGLSGTDGLTTWASICPVALAGLAQSQDESSAVAAGWSPEGFRAGPRLTSGFLDLVVQTRPVPHPPCPLGYAVWGSGAGAVEVGVVWRAELDAEPPERWAGLIRLLPPTGTEACRVDGLCLVESLRSGRWSWSPGQIGVREVSRELVLRSGRGVICRPTGEVEVFGYPSPLGEIAPVHLSPGDTVILPAGAYPVELGTFEAESGSGRAGGCPVFFLGRHLPGLENFPWRRWWRLVRRWRISQTRLARWLTRLALYFEATGCAELVGQLHRALASGTPAALWISADGYRGWVLFPWAPGHEPGDGELMPPGVTWRLGGPSGPRPVTAAAAGAALVDAVQSHVKGGDRLMAAGLTLAAQGLYLGSGYPPLCRSIAAFEGHVSPSGAGRHGDGHGAGGMETPPAVVHIGGASHPLAVGWVLSRTPGAPQWEVDGMGDALAVWDDFPWEFLSVGAMGGGIQSGLTEMSAEAADLAQYLVGTVRGLGRPLPGLPGSGQLAGLAVAAGASVPAGIWPAADGEVRVLPVTDLGQGVVERFWRMQRRFGRWGAAVVEADWRWLVWCCLRRVAGTSDDRGGKG